MSPVRSKRWWREHWPRDVPMDPRFEGLDGQVAECWVGDRLAGYALVVIGQFVALDGPIWRRRTRHEGWEPQVHLALRPAPDAPVEPHWVDSWYAMTDEEHGDFHQQVVLDRHLRWTGESTYDLRWVPEADRAAMIDQYFWVDEDLSAEPTPRRHPAKTDPSTDERGVSPAVLRRLHEAVGVIEEGERTVGWVATLTEPMWSPGHPLWVQRSVWVLISWADGTREPIEEDYPPYALIPDLLDGRYTLDVDGPERRVRWLHGRERQDAWQQHGIVQPVSAYMGPSTTGA